MISTILVPTDGSQTARKAARYAIALAEQLKSTVLIVSVLDNQSLMAQTIPAEDNPHHVIETVDDYLKEAAQAYAKEIKDICDEQGVASRIVIATGHPAEEIIKEAENSNTDLMVIGSHGKSALAAALLGSVSYSIIHNETKIPVLIVRR